MLIRVLILALLVGGAASASEPPYAAFTPPNASRWREDSWVRRHDCHRETSNGYLYCRYTPRGLRRRFENFRADAIAPGQTIKFFIAVFPAFCPLVAAEPAGFRAMHRQLTFEHPRETLEIERPGPNRVIGRSESMRLALVASKTDLVFVVMNVPTGPTLEDDADFSEVLASIRAVEGGFQHRRRGQFLLRTPGLRSRMESIAHCGLSDDARRARAREELLRAVDVDPADWRPYALLGEEAERRGGGPNPGHVAARGRYAALVEGLAAGEIPRRDAGPPLERGALREAIAWYDAALRRGPPVRVTEHSSRYPEDRTLILVRRARAELLLGETDAAQRTYREAFDLAVRPSWGYFQAAFMLAAQADAHSDAEAALPLYRETVRGYLAHMGTDIIRESEGGPLVVESERRIAQIRQARRAPGDRRP